MKILEVRIAAAKRDLQAIQASAGPHTSALTEKYMETLSTEGLVEYKAKLEKAAVASLAGIDRFGEDADTQPKDSDHFTARVQVSVNQTFFAWVFQFAEKVQILGPVSVKEQYQEMLRAALDTNREN